MIRELTKERWADFERLFGPRGACGGCWCMWWRVRRSQFDRQKGELNRRAMKKIVDGGEVPGLVAFAGDAPIGWCAVAPRETYVVLRGSRILKPVDEQPVWSIVCFYVARSHRRSGLTVRLIEAAVRFAQARGARVVEGYPVEPRQDRMPDAFMYHGLASAFLNAGFTEVERRSQTRPIMRRTLTRLAARACPAEALSPSVSATPPR